MPTVTFVCTVNLCRSPIAEVLFRQWLKRQCVSGDWRVLSCGTWARDGAFVPSHVQQSLFSMGIDLRRHLARRVTANILAESDLVLCMTQSHKEALHAEFPQFAGRIRLLSEMVGLTYDVTDVEDFAAAEYVSVANKLVRIIEDAGKPILAMLQPTTGSV